MAMTTMFGAPPRGVPDVYKRQGPCGGDFLDTLPQGGQPRALPDPLVASEPFLNLPHCDRDIRKGGGKLLRKRGDEAA